MNLDVAIEKAFHSIPDPQIKSPKPSAVALSLNAQEDRSLVNTSIYIDKTLTCTIFTQNTKHFPPQFFRMCLPIELLRQSSSSA